MLVSALSRCPRGHVALISATQIFMVKAVLRVEKMIFPSSVQTIYAHVLFW